jgi:membrane protease YdiL (CAAX protease family)
VSGLPGSLADFGPAALAAVVVAGYLVVGEPMVGHVLHRRFEGRLRSDPGARRSFYRRLLVLEWGLALLALVVWLSAPGVDAGQVGLRWPEQWPGPLTGVVVLLVLLFVAVSTRALRGGALLEATAPVRRRPGEGRHSEPPAHATLALLPRTPGERRLFTVVGVTAGVCEEWLYRGFFLAVVAALAGGLPTAVLVVVAAVAFGLAHAYQGPTGIVTTGLLGGVMAAVYLQTGSLLLPILLHAVIDLRFLLVPARVLPTAQVAR